MSSTPVASSSRITILDLPTEVLANIVKHVAIGVNNYRDRVLYTYPLNPDDDLRRDQRITQDAAIQTGLAYERTLSSLHGTCRRLRTLASAPLFDTITLWQTTLKQFEEVFLEHRQLVRTIEISTGRAGMADRSVQKDLSALFSLLPSFPNLDTIFFEDARDWEQFARFLFAISMPGKPIDLVHSISIASLTRQITRLETNAAIPDELSPCLSFFLNVRHLRCQTLSPSQHRIVASWKDLTNLQYERDRVFDQDFGLQEEWAGALRCLELYMAKDALAEKGWPFIMKWASTLEVLKIRLELSVSSNLPPISSTSGEVLFVQLKKLTLTAKTSEAQVLLTYFSGAPLEELVLILDDEGQEEVDTPFEDALRPFQSLRMIRFLRFDQPFRPPACATPTFLDFCQRRAIGVRYDNHFYEHSAYFEVFETTNDDPQLVPFARRAEVVKGIEDLIEYQKRLLWRCVEMEDDAGLNELNRLMQDTAARYMADLD